MTNGERTKKKEAKKEGSKEAHIGCATSSNRDEVPHLFSNVGCRVTPAQRSLKPTVGFKLNKVNWKGRPLVALSPMRYDRELPDLRVHRLHLRVQIDRIPSELAPEPRLLVATNL